MYLYLLLAFFLQAFVWGYIKAWFWPDFEATEQAVRNKHTVKGKYGVMSSIISGIAFSITFGFLLFTNQFQGIPDWAKQNGDSPITILRGFLIFMTFWIATDLIQYLISKAYLRVTS